MHVMVPDMMSLLSLILQCLQSDTKLLVFPLF